MDVMLIFVISRRVTDLMCVFNDENDEKDLFLYGGSIAFLPFPVM